MFLFLEIRPRAINSLRMLVIGSEFLVVSERSTYGLRIPATEFKLQKMSAPSLQMAIWDKTGKKERELPFPSDSSFMDEVTCQQSESIYDCRRLINMKLKMGRGLLSIPQRKLGFQGHHLETKSLLTSKL